MTKKNKNIPSDWLKLYLAPGIGLINALKIYQKFPDLSDFFNNHSEFKLKETTLNWFKNPDQKLIEKHLNWLNQSENHHIISIENKAYPKLLKQISNPPILLFVCGNSEILNQPQISMVGSRNASTQGIEIAQSFATSLSNHNWLITSGLAGGIDSAAHRGAINANKPTLAVMGTGINLIYPTFNQQLAKQILENDGCLISEFPIDAPANSYHFPQRNRIISALSLATIVIEASNKSGSLITAKISNDYGREVYALPSSIYDIKSQGCNQLISEGANIVLSLEHLINELDLNFSYIKKWQDNSDSASKIAGNIDEKNEININHPLLKFIDYQPKSLDEIVFESKIPIQNVQSELTLLEISGHIIYLPDGQVVKKHPF